MSASATASLVVGSAIVFLGCASNDGRASDTTATDASDGALQTPTIDYAKVGAPCGDGAECSAETTCSIFSGFDPPIDGPHCGPLSPCEIVRCPQGQRCRPMLSSPMQVSCRGAE